MTTQQVTSAADDAPQLLRAGGHWPSMLVFASIFASILAIDLVVKYAAFEHVAGVPIVLDKQNPGDPYAIPYHDPVTVVPYILSLRLTTNTGAVFGLGKGQQWFFILISVVATAVILRVFWRSRRSAWVYQICLAMILAGALGNLYDRVVYRAVRDMLWLFPGVKLPFGLSWPGGVDELYPWLFNIADAALVVSVMVLLVILWREDRQRAIEQAATETVNPEG